jgi:hypothetical protein
LKNPKERDGLGYPRNSWDANIKMGPKEIEFEVNGLGLFHS